jgi:two-component SAPR family response regulator
MPTMNGFELYKKMRNIDDNVKVCFITAFEDYPAEDSSSVSGFSEVKGKCKNSVVTIIVISSS